jgi:hypothetical protein
MAELTVIDTNDRVVHRCANFDVGEYGITTMGEKTRRLDSSSSGTSPTSWRTDSKRINSQPTKRQANSRASSGNRSPTDSADSRQEMRHLQNWALTAE